MIYKLIDMLRARSLGNSSQRQKIPPKSKYHPLTNLCSNCLAKLHLEIRHKERSARDFLESHMPVSKLVTLWAYNTKEKVTLKHILRNQYPFIHRLRKPISNPNSCKVARVMFFFGFFHGPKPNGVRTHDLGNVSRLAIVRVCTGWERDPQSIIYEPGSSVSLITQ